MRPEPAHCRGEHGSDQLEDRTSGHLEGNDFTVEEVLRMPMN